ncbi:dihydroxy-acid dehydratase, partial [Mycobacterium tuberculosis]|uniref:dihydroxy-acid dehydratase domain-containing protein n=1 Tax=Mycobacterium tuberculosis TaxID=1773 RepID=UPI000E38F511
AGAVVPPAGFASAVFAGPARVFAGARAALAALAAGPLPVGAAVVLRSAGPPGGPGLRALLALPGALPGAGLGPAVLLLPAGRFSGGPPGLCVGPLAPAA